MRRPLLLLPLVLVLSGCVVPNAVPPPAATPSSTPGAAPTACADSPDRGVDDLSASVTPAELCAEDGQAWRWTSTLGSTWQVSSASQSDDATCEAAGEAVQSMASVLGDRARGLAVDDDVQAHGMSVAVIEHPGLAASAATALDDLRTACDGATVAVQHGQEEIVAIAAEGWDGVQHLGGGPSTPSELETYWLAVGGAAAIVQVDADVDDTTVATLLDAQRTRLESPADPVAAPDDCSASVGDVGLGASEVEVDATELCALDGRPWLGGIGRFVLVDAARSNASGCASFDWLDGIDLSQIQASSLRVGGEDPFGAEAVLIVLDDPSMVTTTADALDRLAASCSGTTAVDAFVATTTQSLDEPDWSSLAFTRTPASETMLDAPDSVLHWIVVDDVLAVVEVPDAFGDAEAQRLLDEQLAALGG